MAAICGVDTVKIFVSMNEPSSQTRTAYVGTLALAQRHLDAISALFFAFVQLIVLASVFSKPETRFYLFWYCNNVAFFYAIAFYFRNYQMVKGMQYIGFLLQLLWNLDLITSYFGFPLSGTTHYIYREGLTFANDVSIFIHAFVPFIVLALVFRFRPQPISLLYSMLYAAGLYVATIAGTNPVEDVNCVFYACTTILPEWQVLLWPLYMAILALLGYGIHLILYRVYRKYHSSR